MPLFECEFCGQEVIALSRPAPMRWTDGHLCFFKAVADPAKAQEPSIREILHPHHAEYREMKPRKFRIGDRVIGKRAGSKNHLFQGELIRTYKTITKQGYRNQGYVIRGENGLEYSFQHIQKIKTAGDPE